MTGLACRSASARKGLLSLRKSPFRNPVRNRFGVRFPGTLPLLRLTRKQFGISRHRVRHGLGFGRRSQGQKEKSL